MLAKTIKFTDYDGNAREETHYFHMNESELTKWLVTTGEATIDKVLLRLTKERNGKEIINIFETLLRAAYGKKSDDGRRFMKSEEIWNDFYQTEGYSELFMELISDGAKTAAFVNAIMPENVKKEVQDAIRKNKAELPAELLDYVPKDV